jgi:hypothetical protein
MQGSRSPLLAHTEDAETKDGKKFLIHTRVEQADQPITIYSNWLSDLHPK